MREKTSERDQERARESSGGGVDGGGGCALWLKIEKKTVLGHSLVHSLAPFTCLLAPDCSLRSRPPSIRSLVHSLCSVPRSWDSE